MSKTLLSVSALLLSGVCAFAAPAAPKAKSAAKKPAPAAKKAAAAPLVCPVTGEKIASIKVAAGSSTYKGKTYYFCCDGCKPAFDKDPSKFLNADGTIKAAH